MTIVEFRCPRCAIRRTARLGEWGRFCFNCRLRWHGEVAPADAALAPHTVPFAATRYPFGPHELRRLEWYRAAIQNGLYGDWSLLPTPDQRPTA